MPASARCRRRLCDEDGDPTSVLLVAGRPAVAYIRIDEVDGAAHVDQLAVLPSVARQGIGRALLDAAVEWAAQHGYAGDDAEHVRRVGVERAGVRPDRVQPAHPAEPGLRELRDWERAIGLDAIGARVVMRRELSA